MKTLSKHHIEAIEKAKTELGKINAAALAMIETPMDLIKAVLLKHEVAVLEVMCELHQQRRLRCDCGKKCWILMDYFAKYPIHRSNPLGILFGFRSIIEL